MQCFPGHDRFCDRDYACNSLCAATIEYPHDFIPDSITADNAFRCQTLASVLHINMDNKRSNSPHTHDNIYSTQVHRFEILCDKQKRYMPETFTLACALLS